MTDMYLDIVARTADYIRTHPYLPTGTTIPVIADAELADPDLGTGAVKITPAHDPNDLACAQVGCCCGVGVYCCGVCGLVCLPRLACDQPCTTEMSPTFATVARSR